MCGRYALFTGSEFYDRFSLTNRLDNLLPNYNVTPGSVQPIITHQSPNTVYLKTWGLVPAWAKDPKMGFNLINARAETINKLPSFRSAFLSRRCLVPANGFFEWQKLPDKRQPYYFFLKDNPLFAFAGLYENNTYTIITTEANSLVKSVHERMPVILKKSDESTWLDANTPTNLLFNLLKPYPAERMSTHPVSLLLNRSFENSSKLIKPLK